MAILGIDTGLKGALALWQDDHLIIEDMPVEEVITAKKTSAGKKDTKKNRVDVVRLASFLGDAAKFIDYAIIETTTPFTNAGGKVPAQTYHLMGVNEGIIMGVLAAYDIPYKRVLAHVWKRGVECPKDKNGARERASQVFPAHSELWKLKKWDGRAEAALIAYYSTILEKESNNV